MTSIIEGVWECQEGAWNAIKPAIATDQARLGASHATEHKLDRVFGVDHGLTTYAIKMNWSSFANAARQAHIFIIF